MLEGFIIIFYFLLCSYILLKSPFIARSGLTKFQILLLYILKISAGFAFAFFYKLPQYYENADTWRFYNLSLAETQWLLNNPKAFIKDLFFHGYNNSGNIFSGTNSYWNDLKSNVLIKLIAVINIVTNKSYYALIILFNCFFIFGLVALYRVLITGAKHKAMLAIAGVFLIPSTLFWCSGVHKDGFILTFTSFIIYLFYKYLHLKKTTLFSIIIIIFSTAILFSLRNYVVFALLPALLCWWLSVKFKAKPILVFTIIYISGIVIFFTIPYLIPSLNFPGFISNKQQEFLALSGGSSVTNTPLQPNIISFFKYLPTALDLAFLRPHLSEGKGLGAMLAFSEILLVLLICSIYFLFPKKDDSTYPKYWALLFFAFSILIITGFTITFSGAVVRYRSFVIPFIITPLLLQINFIKIKRILN